MEENAEEERKMFSRLLSKANTEKTWLVLAEPSSQKGWKIHIPVHYEDIENVAYDVYKKIKEFKGVGLKTAPPDFAREYLKGNQRGKSIVNIHT